MYFVDLQQSGDDDISSRRSAAALDQSATTKITQDSQQVRRTAADDSAVDEFDVYTIETALPHVEWERIEESLRMSAGEEKKRWVNPPASVMEMSARIFGYFRTWVFKRVPVLSANGN